MQLLPYGTVYNRSSGRLVKRESTFRKRKNRKKQKQ